MPDSQILPNQHSRGDLALAVALAGTPAPTVRYEPTPAHHSRAAAIYRKLELMKYSEAVRYLALHLALAECAGGVESLAEVNGTTIKPIQQSTIDSLRANTRAADRIARGDDANPAMIPERFDDMTGPMP